jgi:phage I-like protein
MIEKGQDRQLSQTAVNAMETPVVSGTVPEWIPLLPAGDVRGRDGRAWVNNSPELILESFVEGAMDLPVDIEHSTEYKAPHGEPAPAIAWIVELQERDGGIWGKVSWNSDGEELVRNRAYRYHSPVIKYRKDSGEIVAITSVAVTNQPNLKLSALNQQQAEKTKETSMSTVSKALLAALGLADSATEQEALDKLSTIKTDLASASNRADNPSLEKFVPRADYDAALAKASNARQELESLKKEGLETAVNAAIQKALEDGKITPATRAYHEAQCRQDGGLELFAAFCESAPVIGGDSGLDGQDPDRARTALNAQEKEVCAKLAIREEDYLKARA